MKKGLTPKKIVSIYALTGGLWIIFSDRILTFLTADPEILTQSQTYKGWLFVAVTAVLLLWLISRYAAENEKTIAAFNESEAYNRDLFMHSLTGLVVCRMDGSLVDVNPAYAQIIGRSVKETLSLTYWDITPEKYVEQEQEQLEYLKKTGSYGPYEKEYIHKDGNFIPVRLQGRIIERNGEKLIWSSVEDISGQKVAEKELRDRENQLRLFVEYSPAAIAMFDLEMKYIVASRRWHTDYNLGDVQIIGRSHYDIFPDIPERWKAIHKRCLAGAVERCEEDPFPRVDGSIDWVRWEVHPWRHSDGSIGGIIIFSEVITERKKVEEELHMLNKELDKRVKERTDELEIKIAEIERLNMLFVGREMKMIELKGRIKELEKEVAGFKFSLG